MQDYIKHYSKRHPDVILKVIPGHFVTPNSHINYYIDMTTMKTRAKEAQAAARAMAENYASSTIIDTIVCMDGMEVIGAYLAESLAEAGVLSINAHKTIYVVPPEYDNSGQMIFRENTAPMMIKGKHVLLVLASATTGGTIARAGECVNYYGGVVTGISAIFSAVNKVDGYPVHALFTTNDLPDYRAYSPHNCALCRNAVRIDAMCNSFGFSQLR